MTKTKTTLVGIGTAIALSAVGWADDSTANTIKNTAEHPVEAYHQHEVKSDSADAQMAAQQQAEAKARLDQAKKDYEKSLQANGADSVVTKEAKKRLSDAKKEYKKYAKKVSEADKDLREDTQKLQQDKTVQ